MTYDGADVAVLDSRPYCCILFMYITMYRHTLYIKCIRCINHLLPFDKGKNNYNDGAYVAVLDSGTDCEENILRLIYLLSTEIKFIGR